MNSFFDKIKTLLGNRPNFWKQEIEENFLDEFLSVYGALTNSNILLSTKGLYEAPLSICGNFAEYLSFKDGFDVCCSSNQCTICKEIKHNKRMDVLNAKIRFVPQNKCINAFHDELVIFISELTPKQYNSELNKSSLYKYFEEFYFGLNEVAVNSETIYLALNKLHQPPKCSCGNYCEFKSLSAGYNLNKCILGTKCLVCNKSRKIKTSTRMKENAETYGFKSDKFKNTMQTKYNCTNINEFALTKEKAKNTSLIKYGTEYPMQNPNILKKAQNTNLLKYDVDNPMKLNWVKEKVKKTNLERYGSTSPMHIDRIKEKVKKTNLDRYGNEYFLGTPGFAELTKKTMQEKYGAEHYQWTLKAIELRQKNLEAKIKKLFKENKLEPLDFMGFEYFRAYNLTCTLCNKSFKKNITPNCNLKCPHCKPPSTEELDFRNTILSLTSSIPIFNDRTVLAPQELDIYIPELNIAFEYNGLYWHQESKQGKNSEYKHQQKVIQCREKGIKLVTVFSDDWLYKREIVIHRLKSLLSANKPLYARKCRVELIQPKEAKDFLDTYHIQKSVPSSIQYGLMYDNELQAVMTFGASRYNKNYQWELLRYASKENIIGGASKLLAYFKLNKNPESLMTYADLAYGYGDVYIKIGFTFKGLTAPDYYWVNSNAGIRENRQKFQKHKLVQEGYDPTLSEREIMTNRGFYKVYGCGNAIYEWRRD